MNMSVFRCCRTTRRMSKWSRGTLQTMSVLTLLILLPPTLRLYFTPCSSFLFLGGNANPLQVLASCSYDDTIRLWKEDDDDWQCVTTLTGHTSTVWSIAFSPNGSHLASVSDDKSLKVWESQPDQSWKCVSTVPNAHTRAIYSVSWSKDNLLATAGGDNCIKIFHKARSRSLSLFLVVLVALTTRILRNARGI